MDLVSFDSEYTRFRDALEAVKRTAPNGVHVWRGRDLQPVLGYSTWENFDGIVRKAIAACESANAKAENHFRDVTKMVPIGSGAKRRRSDWLLSRYACYLIAMNSDATKPEVGYAQTYFAVQTRRQELADEKRVDLRIRIMDSNHQLSGVAKQAGVQRYALFQDAGYRGLYGMGLASVKAVKGLKPNQELLDHAGELELSANYFRSALTRHRLERDKVRGELAAMTTHETVGKEVRASIVKDNGIEPENLPIEPSIKSLVLKRKRGLASGDGQLPTAS